MGARGPAPTPTNILRLRGSWRADANKGEPQPPRGAPPCPRDLPKKAKAVWKRVCGILASMDLLTTADGQQLERYSRFFVRWKACENFIDANGMSYPLYANDPGIGYVGKMPDGRALIRFIEYPQVRESHRLDKALKQIEANFGLTPSARARLTAPAADVEQDEDDAYFGRRGLG